MPGPEQRDVSEQEFGETVLEQVRRACARQASDSDLVQRVQAGTVTVQVALPFRVKVRVTGESERRPIEPCCVCVEEDGEVGCWGSCC